VQLLLPGDVNAALGGDPARARFSPPPFAFHFSLVWEGRERDWVSRVINAQSLRGIIPPYLLISCSVLLMQVVGRQSGDCIAGFGDIFLGHSHPV